MALEYEVRCGCGWSAQWHPYDEAKRLLAKHYASEHPQPVTRVNYRKARLVTGRA